jgi:integrase
VALCAFAGLRLGETAALKAGDLDAVAKTLKVARQVQRERGSGVDVTPQLRLRADCLPVGRTTCRTNSSHCSLCTWTRTQGGSLDGWFLLGENGNPPHQNSLGYWWRKTREAIGYPTPRLHDLRHLYASGLIAAGCDVVTAPCSLGHSSATITLNTYAHLWPSAQDRTRAASSRLFVDVTRVSDESLTNDQAA